VFLLSTFSLISTATAISVIVDGNLNRCSFDCW